MVPTLIGVALGFVLAVGWEMVRNALTRARRDAAVLEAAIAEIDAARATAANNQQLARDDMSVVKSKGDDIVNPLDPVEGGFWDVIKYDPPRGLTVDPAALARVRDVARRTDQVNEMIRAREAFKSSQAKPADFQTGDRLVAYDALIDMFSAQLIEKLDALKPAVEAAQQRRPMLVRLARTARMIALQRPVD